MRNAQVTMSRIGYSILQESRAFSNEKQSTGRPETSYHSFQRISDEDVIAQVPTFLVAGHETTAAAVSRALFSVTERSDIQAKLRTEILSVATESPTFDELNALPYLDMVLKETLRLHAPVTSTARVATKDDLIPVSKHFRHADGVTRDYIGIKKGEAVIIPLRLMNIDTAIWGDDAEVFKPERWENLPSATSAIPGVWGNMMTFLGGPRSCIGYRFALAEAKAILFTLLRAFEFELAVPHHDVGKKAHIVDRPYVKSDEAAGYQLPMIVRAVTHP
ncbi:cytochrome P450 [Hymenopellis radicata]|nr:cytochrome P450 [Hymenopellis radicata]